ncbi:TIGR04086 family membrane protein [Selenomonadales bacterium OttesenSCG-928-I06]|nr:TIGR04086 family membrane protein [Selenomonadales bacterium OttesenSCG-928-I06]
MRTYKKEKKSSRPIEDKKRYFILVLKGVVVSIIISMISIFFLSLVTIVTDLYNTNTTIGNVIAIFSYNLDFYLNYIMIGITMLSIFFASLYIAKVSQRRGALLGIAIGCIYVLFSVGISTDLGQNQIFIASFLNKLLAGCFSGALGGFIGVNMS